MNNVRSLTCLALLASLAAPAVHAAGTDEVLWSQWRGLSRDGASAGQPWPDALTSLGPQWSMPLGDGYSGPVVSERAVFVAESLPGEERMHALDRDTGEVLWQTTWSGEHSVPFFARRNGSWIRATPTYTDGSLFIGGIEEVLHRIDAETGAMVWSVDFKERFGTKVPDFGFVSAPLVDAGVLYVQAANSLVKLDVESGETIWRVLANEGSIMQSGAFSSPILAELAGRRQLLVQTREILYGVDPADGSILWQQLVPSFRGMNILTPLVVGDMIFTSTHRNKSFAYQVEATADGGFQVQQVWEYKGQGYMSSPLHLGDEIYLHLGNGRLTALDVASGEDLWTTTPFGSYWSMAKRDDKMLALDSDGELVMLRANRKEAEVLDRREITDEQAWGHLAPSGDQIFVRSQRGIHAFQWQRAKAAPTATP